MIDLIIIGAGPAGLSAGIAAAEQGLRVTIVDEYFRAGGRLLGQLHQEPNGDWWNGIKQAQVLIEKTRSLGIEIKTNVSVYDIKKIDRGWKIYTFNGIIDTKLLLLATGSYETSVPIPGWTLPGVMTVGAAQVMTNVNRVKVGKRGMIIGINLLSAAITQELILAGIEIAAFILPARNPATGNASSPLSVMQSMQRLAHLAPSPIIRLGSKFLVNNFIQELVLNMYPKHGFNVWGVPIQLRKAVTEIYGDSKVEGVKTVNISAKGDILNGKSMDIEVDFVCISGGLSPLVELAYIAGCKLCYASNLGGHIPVHNERMQTTVEGLFVAGNITGIESAKVAMAQGTVAGLSIAIASDSIKYKIKLISALESAIKDVHNIRKNAMIQFNSNIDIARKKMYDQTSII